MSKNLKDGSMKDLRKIHLYDDTGKIELSLWGESADINIKEGDIVLFTNIIIKDYMGKSVSFTSNSKYFTEIPQCQRYNEIMLWKRRDGNIENLKKLTHED